ncbi:hypothetical protein [Archangium lansingense]|uniref:Uncharacterized protein n=1 Tax=Archangium lansingense TaxID=2995310 RepID=A0ABT4A5B8_9BACT|nr:hypothetical protein [Archangium lansinium]MCY1076832.1 hypothetical protein [Archangium lansinium]
MQLVTVKALLSAEQQTPVAHGKKGRDELVCRFTESGAAHLFRARRCGA